MPVVRISDETWARLQQHAQPLVDTPDTVIGLALDALDAAKADVPPARRGLLTSVIEKSRQERGELTPQRDFRPVLLKTLLQLGGRAPAAKIREALEKKLILKPGDREKVSSGDIRWWNAVCWERADLVREGLFRDDSSRGTWELSERGKSEAQKLK